MRWEIVTQLQRAIKYMCDNPDSVGVDPSDYQWLDVQQAFLSTPSQGNPIRASEFPVCLPPWPQAVAYWNVNGQLVAAVTRIYGPMSKKGEIGSCAGLIWPYVEWIGQAKLFFEERGRLRTSPYTISWGATSERQLASEELIVAHGETNAPAPELQNVTWVMRIPFLAWSLATCRNVVLRERTESKRITKGVNRVISYKVLDIEPIKYRYAGDQSRPDNPQALPLHIVRGHFKEFSGKGLFGKYRGRYWWSSFARGDAENGIAVKDYRTIAPESMVLNGIQ